MQATPVLVLAMTVLARPGDAECPGCDRTPHTRIERSKLDHLRLDLIQRDILYKLGLRDRPPNITASVPRDVLIRTLVRARATTNLPTGQQPTADFEDGKARTSEIIAMARPGQFSSPPRDSGSFLTLIDSGCRALRFVCSVCRATAKYCKIGMMNQLKLRGKHRTVG